MRSFVCKVVGEKRNGEYRDTIFEGLDGVTYTYDDRIIALSGRSMYAGRANLSKGVSVQLEQPEEYGFVYVNFLCDSQTFDEIYLDDKVHSEPSVFNERKIKHKVPDELAMGNELYYDFLPRTNWTR